jgi:hypothetical protein
MVGTPMRTYARVQDGMVAELLRTDGDITNMFNAALVWLDVSSQPDIADGWNFDGESFTPPVISSPTASLPTIAELRAQIAALDAQLTVLSNNN